MYVYKGSHKANIDSNQLDAFVEQGWTREAPTAKKEKAATKAAPKVAKADSKTVKV